MEKIEELSVRMMYRVILKGMKHYPSTTKVAMKEAIMADVRDWVKETEELEQAKALKKMRMLYGHIIMWNMKMEEVSRTDTEKIEEPFPHKDLNHKKDKDFVWF